MPWLSGRSILREIPYLQQCRMESSVLRKIQDEQSDKAIQTDSLGKPMTEAYRMQQRFVISF